MITAKDIFSLEREQLYELQGLVYSSDMDSHEKGDIFERLTEEITFEEYERIRIDVLQRQTSSLTRLKNGETMSAKQIGEAVKQASNETTT